MLPRLIGLASFPLAIITILHWVLNGVEWNHPAYMFWIAGQGLDSMVVMLQRPKTEQLALRVGEETANSPN